MHTIAVPAVKVFGPNNYNKLDPITVSMRHPDALTALLSPPWREREAMNLACRACS